MVGEDILNHGQAKLKIFSTPVLILNFDFDLWKVNID